MQKAGVDLALDDVDSHDVPVMLELLAELFVQGRDFRVDPDKQLRGLRLTLLTRNVGDCSLRSFRAGW